jgi:hypothetical protein
MFGIVLFGLAAWAAISVPVALILGRCMAQGSKADGVDSAFADSEDRQLPKVA